MERFFGRLLAILVFFAVFFSFAGIWVGQLGHLAQMNRNSWITFVILTTGLAFGPRILFALIGSTIPRTIDPVYGIQILVQWLAGLLFRLLVWITIQIGRLLAWPFRALWARIRP